MTESTRDFFNTLARILLRCWICGFVLLFAWLGAFVSHAIHRLHSPLMDLPAHELNVIHYCGMASFKLVVLTLFFIPWLSIQLVLRRAKLQT